MPKNNQPKRSSMVGGAPNASLVEKPKDFKKSLKKLFKSLKYHRLAIIVTIIFAIAGTVFSIVGPKLMGNMINQVTNDYVLRQVYDEVKKTLPENVTLPEGTTLQTLPTVVQEMAANGQINMTDLQQLQSSSLNNNDNSELMQRLNDEQKTKIMNIDLNKRPDFNYAAILNTAILLVALYVAAAICSYASGWIMTSVTMKMVKRFRKDISHKINRLPIAYFDQHQYGDTLSRVTNDVDTIAQSLNQTITQLISSAALVIGILVMMLTISWQMTVIALLVLPISAGFLSFVAKKSQYHFKNQQDELGNLNGHIEEVYAGHAIIRAFNHEDEAIKQFANTNNKLYKSSWKAQFISGLMFPIMHFISNLGYVATAIVGGYLAINRIIGIGDIAAFIQYVNQFNQPIAQFSQIINVLQSAVAASERYFEFLEEPEQVPDYENAIMLPKVQGKIEFKHVCFEYQAGQPVIKDFNAKIKSGQMVAVVGPTGAGKTTLVNLLMRFYDPTAGEILIDDKNSLEIKRSEVRKAFGMVLQDTWLINGTIMENLKYGKPDISDKTVKKIAKTARINHIIEALPHGYDTVIDQDVEIVSAGEKQLLTIVRAMVANAPMMILDEATSNVDTRTEVLIQQAMEKLTKNRTSFVIAHRLSTIRNADLILVMNEGDIVEQGTHAELIKKNGFYAGLYNSQFVDS
ncbi:MAG: ABC transporter ATP-binding protein/permease [Candidatus Nomurabacteria bacterium]|jgi:ATP-binding cassette subfamily B protein|nr:ABC transporter ATP-binding protein/permease [Candidatus Nomurabacteria bacterium]